MGIRNYFSQVLEALSQLLNTIFGGYADEMLSARLHRHRNTVLGAFFRSIVNSLFFWQDDHCLIAYDCEWQRKGNHPHYNVNKYNEIRK